MASEPPQPAPDTHAVPASGGEAGPVSAGAPTPAAASGLPVFLSTEHWSLLGTRSMTWSEVMSRITILLTVVSALIVVVGLVGQVAGLTSTTFRVLSICSAASALVLGELTAIRVNMASREDASLVLAMNRMRAAYVELHPEAARWFTASSHDDQAGLMHTYALGQRRNTVMHVIGSTSFFVMTVNTLLAATLGALVAGAAGGSALVIVVVAALGGIANTVGQMLVGWRLFGRPMADVRFPTTDAPG